MKIKLWKYKIPLVNPVNQMTHREGLIVEMEGGGLGEIAPLPGFSKESLEEAEREVKEVLLKKKTPTLPSVQFGMMSARKKLAPLPPIPYAQLLWGTREEILKAVSSNLCKIKISLFPLDKGIELIKELKKTSPSLKFRMDCNRKWSLEEALFFTSHFTKEDFAYLEEPVRSFEELEEFSKKTGFPIAVDETLLSESLDRILSLPSLRAGVIKPSVVPSFPEVISHFQKRGIATVYSSAIESGVGIHSIARLASENSPPIGIDTYRFLKEDILKTPLRFSEGKLLSTPIELDQEKLCLIFSVP